MLQFIPLAILLFTLTKPEPARAECLMIKVSGGMGEQYGHFRDHKKERRHHHGKRKHHCRSGHYHPHHPPHHHPPHHHPHPHHKPCMVCRISDDQVTEIVRGIHTKPEPADAGFCSFPKGEFRSQKFLIDDQPHILSILIANNDLVIDLLWLNNERNVADDGKYFAFPEGFSNPAKATQIPISQFSDKAQLESKSFSCNNTRSLTWNSDTGRVLPSFFGGQINMVYTKDIIFTETSLTTDLSSTAYMPIQLKRIPDKKAAQTK